MTADRVLRVPRGTLAAAVSPEPLEVVLDGLVTVGAVHGYEVRGEEVLVWGDLAAMHAVIEHSNQQPATVFDGAGVVHDGRQDYYSAARAFMHDPRYRRIPAISKRVWAMHAEGASWQQIAAKLKVTVGKVREVVRGARILAGLPETVHSTPRGGGTGCKTPFRKCAVKGCELRGSWRGRCSRHYQQAKTVPG